MSIKTPSMTHSSTGLNRSRGMTLIELVIAIIIISVGVAGVLLAFSTVVNRSADPLVRKQMLAIAEEMMEEITLQPFAIDGSAPANVLGNCGAGASRAAFNDVRDFNGYQTTGICNIDGDAISGLESYNVGVAVMLENAVGNGALAAGDVLRIVITVAHGMDTVSLTGWRANYAP